MALASTSNVPAGASADFVCPITQELMRDPVVDREGNSYERSAIEQWVRDHGTSPITRRPLDIRDLTPNRALKNAIETFRNGGTQEGTAAPATAAPAQQQQPQPAQAASAPASADASIKFVYDAAASRCLLSIVPPSTPARGATRAPVDIVCVVDTSGSMSTPAEVKNEKGATESHGLSVLDVVKHSVRTVANMLGPNDRLAIVEYNSTAKQVLGLTAMGTAGHTAVTDALKTMRPMGRTNLWDGLQTGMDMVKESKRNAAVLLLTDGCPNVEPPRGHIPTLKNYYERLGGVPPFVVSTFGFGYDLDSQLLNDIALESNGSYVFIPDSGLVGTVFVNHVANLLSTFAGSLTLSVETPTSVTDTSIACPRTTFGLAGNLGSLLYGQSRDVAFTVAPAEGAVDPAKFFAKVEYQLNGVKKSITATAAAAPEAALKDIAAHTTRNSFCQYVAMLARREVAAQDVQAVANAWPPVHPLVEALVADTLGEVVLGAKSADNFQRWGRHYLPSLVCANVQQQCNNFKDKSVQLYGGALFRKLRDEGEAIFLKLPPPEPTVAPAAASGRRSSTTTSHAPAARAAPRSMNWAYNASGGCVAAHCRVSLVDGTTKPASAVCRGDQLSNGATVVCCVDVAVQNGRMAFVELEGGLLVSPYHPVRVHGKWHFPETAPTRVASKTLETNTMYSYVLDHTHVVPTEGVDVVAMGHGFTEDAVIAHDFFGTHAVVDALRTLDGFDEGRVRVGGFVRDAATNLVVGLHA